MSSATSAKQTTITSSEHLAVKHMKAEQFTSTQKQKQQCRLQTAEHIQVKSRGAHPRGGKPKREEEMHMYLSHDLVTLG